MNINKLIFFLLLLETNVVLGQDFQGLPNDGHACVIIRLLENDIAHRELIDTSYSWVSDLSQSCLRVSETLLDEYYFPKVYNKYYYDHFFGDSLTLEEIANFKDSVKSYVNDLEVENSFYQTCRCNEESKPCFMVQLSPIINEQIAVKVFLKSKNEDDTKVLKLLFPINQNRGDVEGYMIIP